MAKKITLVIMLTVLLTGSAYSSGFQINEHGAKAMSLAGAFTALANDASAVQYNPAALVYLDGTIISLGSTYIRPSGSFEGPDGALSTKSDLKNRFFTPINFYITHKIILPFHQVPITAGWAETRVGVKYTCSNTNTISNTVSQIQVQIQIR